MPGFDLEAYNKRVEDALDRRAARRASTTPPTLIERLKAVRKLGQKLATLPRV